MGLDYSLDSLLFERIFVEKFDVGKEGWDPPFEARKQVRLNEFLEFVT